MALFRVTRNGTSPGRRRLELLGFYVDRNEGFTRACAGSDLPMLTRAKPYGSLVLLAEEMEQFVEELRATAGRWAQVTAIDAGSLRRTTT